MTAKQNEIKTAVTPYEGAQMLTDRLAEMGITKKINGPMIYIYGLERKAFKVSRGIKKTKKGTDKEVWVLDMKTFLPWMEIRAQEIFDRTNTV